MDPMTAYRLVSALAIGTVFIAACSEDPVPPAETPTTTEGPESSTGAPVTSGPVGTTVDDPTRGEPDGTTMPDDDDDDGSTGSGIKLDVGSGQDSHDIELTGRVLAPNGEIPIAGALVYLTTQPPAGIPDGVYCDECETLGPQEFFTTTAPDGTFQLIASSNALGQEDTFLVIKKGQFLRVSPITVSKGEQAVAELMTQLPGVHDPASGRWIPRIAVYETWPDEVFNVLAKFGLAQVSPVGTLVPGTEQFTLLPDNSGALMDDLTQMSQYHIIFLPCATSVFWPEAPFVSSQRIQNIRDYVAAGGRWYATDHSNEYIKDPFPSYLDLHSPAMPDIQPAYTVSGTVVDEELLSWLDALPPALADIGGGNPTLGSLPFVDLMDNYSGIDAVHEVLVPDGEGMNVNVGPHTWVSGPCTSCADPIVERPMAITGQYGCGRMMYSTFETSSAPHQGLNPQELLLLYMILEIGTCQEDLVPPPQG